ncbi:MAG TPA: methionine synthase [Alphaproteobacteria bacterium]|nr:methionine synthase [Alphaproteobacteria bacterium]
MLETTIAGSLPKPFWLAETEKLWPAWRHGGEALAQAKRDATLLWLKEEEAAGIDIVTDGEQSRQHFVHGFLERIEGIDFQHKKRIGIRDNRYEANCPTVVGAIARRRSVHGEEARFARAYTRHKLKFTIPGPMTIVDTLADAYYNDRPKLAMAFARVINEEARELEDLGVDVLQLDEPAFNAYPEATVEWGVEALNRAVEGLRIKTAVHICYGYGIKANIDWKKSLGGEWRQYEHFFPALARSRIDQVSLECAASRVPISLLGLLEGKEVMVGVIDVASHEVETPEAVCEVIRRASSHVPLARIIPCTNCGMAPLPREVARGKLRALTAGAALARKELAGG